MYIYVHGSMQMQTSNPILSELVTLEITEPIDESLSASVIVPDDAAFSKSEI